MVSSHILAIFSLIAAIVSTSTMAKEFIVGDQAGWTIGFDYKNWAQGKNFMVGDTLVFTYPVGNHNVLKVNGTEFQNCIVPTANEALSTGKDIIVLGSSGKKWYICGVGQHCAQGGQKLAIQVMENILAPAPSPSSGVKATISKLSMMMIFAIVTLVIMV